MKRIFSFLLAILLLVSAAPMAQATNDYTAGTKVVYTNAQAAEAYTITVPAQLAPGGSGTVTLAGTWASNRVVSVTADTSVRLTNSINSADYKDLVVTFASMEYAGDNTQAKTYTENVSVAEMPADALFGTWSGNFNYNVEVVDAVNAPAATTFSFNGVELPALPEWDKSAYPYVVIRDCSSPGINSYCYDVYAYPVKPTAIVEDGILNSKLRYVVVEEGTNWLYVATIEDEGEEWHIVGEEQTAYKISAIWANTDIAYEDGSLYLAASEPIPVYE